jgi:hypothetical protein
MDASRFVHEVIPHVFAVFPHHRYELPICREQFAAATHHERLGFFRLRYRLARLRITAMLADRYGRRYAPDIEVSALRARQEATLALGIKVLCIPKPAFEAMAVLARQVVDDHLSLWCPGRGSNPYSHRPRDFKSLVSTSFTTRAAGSIDRTKKTKEGKRCCAFPLVWSGRRVSNSRPQPWQGCALPTELLPRYLGGASRSRTDLHGFAIRCITALLSRLA